jgi:adenine phosphoribosyltransferase
VDNLKKMIRTVPDFPKPGIQFYDITTLLKEPYGLRTTIDRLTELIDDPNINTVVGMEARGFIFAPALAYRVGAGFVPVRKPHKLPAETESVSYQLEYGTDTLEIHKDAIRKGDRVIIADDLLATGGTAAAVVDLVERLGGEVAALAFVVELSFLNGRERFANYKVASLLQYDE